jgi:hypothetical protein
MLKLCKYNNCNKRATYGLQRDNPLKCKDHNYDNMKRCSKICRCGKSVPNYNEPDQQVGVCCKNCKTETMINLKSKKRKKCKCGKAIPVFNEPGEKNGICCKNCKTKTMINLKDKKRKKCKCGKSIPYFNEPGKKNGICCKNCKTKTMINVRSKKCKCGKTIPYFNEPGEKNGICCLQCKTETMINISYKKCKCGKYNAIFNEPGKKNGICCKYCKTKTMIDVTHKKCKCGITRPCFNEPKETIGICCIKCKTSTMIDVVNRRCKCGKTQPQFNEVGNKTGICCSTCKTDTMVNVITKKCNGIINYNNIIYDCPYNNKGNKKYRNYCTDCFKHNFPLDQLTFKIRTKSKEILVRNFINKNFEGFQHDKTLSTSHCDCTVKRRIDHRKLIKNTLLVIETDENQHKPYNKMDEETRYDDLYMAYSGKWIYIRFNPDSFKDKNGKLRNPRMPSRLKKLKLEIDKQIKRIENEENTELVERIYMYYDEYI